MKYSCEEKPNNIPELIQYYSDRMYRFNGMYFHHPYMPAYPAVWDGCWTFVIEEKSSISEKFIKNFCDWYGDGTDTYTPSCKENSGV